MGWEFAASATDEADQGWQWVWRRIADDSGVMLHESAPFAALEDCITDAKKHGFDETACSPLRE